MAWSHSLFHQNRQQLEAITDPRISDALAGVMNAPACLTPDGQNLILDGKPLYHADFQTSSHDQAALFMASPIRISIATGAKTQDHTDSLATLICSVIENEAQSFPQSQSKPVFDQVGALVSFGLGLGGHLAPLTESFDYQNLVILEPNLDFLIASLGTLDWAPIIKALQQRGGLLYFIFDEDPSTAFSLLSSILRDRPFAQLEGSLLYPHYSSRFLQELHARFLEYGTNILYYNGWLEDDVLHIRNHAANTLSQEASNTYLFIPNSETPNVKRGPAIICGAGPSLTKQIALLKDNRHNFSLFSSGTSLGAILSEGIRPDFHSEIENLSDIGDILRATHTRYGFDGITLIGSTTIDPSIQTLFEERLYYVREGDGIMSSAAGDVGQTDLTGPTCINASLRIAHALGFGPIFLLGTDFGVTDPTASYAKGAIYYALDEINRDREERGDLKIDQAGSTIWGLEDRVPGARGGYVLSNPVFIANRHRLEDQIQLLAPEIYNLGDGSDIRGAPYCSETQFLSLMRQAPQAHAGTSRPPLIDSQHSRSMAALLESGSIPKTEALQDLADRMDRHCEAFHQALSRSPGWTNARELLSGLSEHLPSMAGSILRGRDTLDPVAISFEGSFMRLFHLIRHFEARCDGENRAKFVTHATRIVLDFKDAWAAVTSERLRRRLDDIDPSSSVSAEHSPETDQSDCVPRVHLFRALSKGVVVPTNLASLKTLKALKGSHPWLHDTVLYKYLLQLSPKRVEPIVLNAFYDYFFEAVPTLPPPGALLSLALEGLAFSYPAGHWDQGLVALLSPLSAMSDELSDDDHRNIETLWTKLRQEGERAGL